MVVRNRLFPKMRLAHNWVDIMTYYPLDRLVAQPLPWHTNLQGVSPPHETFFQSRAQDFGTFGEAGKLVRDFTSTKSWWSSLPRYKTRLPLDRSIIICGMRWRVSSSWLKILYRREIWKCGDQSVVRKISFYVIYEPLPQTSPEWVIGTDSSIRAKCENTMRRNRPGNLSCCCCYLGLHEPSRDFTRSS